MISCPTRTNSMEKLLVSSNVALAVFLISLLALCASPSVGQEISQTDSARHGPQALSGVSSEGAQDANRPALQRRDWRYQLQPGDAFNISFPFTPEFDQQDVPVQPDGYASLHGVGDLAVAGKTLPELRELLRAAYSKVVSPQPITVELKTFEKPYFLVGGEVERPGKYDLKGDTTVAQAVTVAGGFRDTAKHSQVLLFRRISDQWMEAKKLDLKKMLKAGDLSEDLHLRPGDMVYVPKNAISKIKQFLPIPSVGTSLSPPL